MLRAQRTGYLTRTYVAATSANASSAPGCPFITVGLVDRVYVISAPLTVVLYPQGAGTILFGCALHVTRSLETFSRTGNHTIHSQHPPLHTSCSGSAHAENEAPCYKAVCPLKREKLCFFVSTISHTHQLCSSFQWTPAPLKSSSELKRK